MVLCIRYSFTVAWIYIVAMHCNTHSRSCSVEKFFFFFVPSRRTYFPRLPSIGRHSARFSRLRTREYLANFIHYHKSPTIFTRRKTSFASPCFFLFFFTFRLAYVHSRTPVGSSSQPAIKRRGWWRWWAPTTLRHYLYYPSSASWLQWNVNDHHPAATTIRELN